MHLAAAAESSPLAASRKSAATRCGTLLPRSCCRVACASVMLSGGVPLEVVSEVFGHTSVAITGDVYGHVSPDVSREALT
jgi:site-specific recombinase XerD